MRFGLMGAKLIRSGGNADRGLKPGPVRHKKRTRAEYGGKAGYGGKGTKAARYRGGSGG